MKTKLSLLLLSMFISTFASAQAKYLGGEIRVKQTGTYSVVASIDIFTSINDDIQDIQLSWGDGTISSIPLISSEELSGVNMKYSQFLGEHIYADEATYTLSIEECCWADNIINISEVNPINFQLNTQYFHNVNDPLLGINEMPFFEEGILTGNALQLVNYTSNFTDLEGDDVHIEVCDIDYILSYNEITEVYPINNMLLLDSLNGSFNWITPQVEGNYLLALCVSESRNGITLSQYTRNIMIAVEEPLSNQEIFQDKNIKVIPNPATDLLNIQMPDGNSEISVSLFDAQGRRVLDHNSGVDINVSGLDAGLYFLLIRNEGILYSSKVLLK